MNPQPPIPPQPAPAMNNPFDPQPSTLNPQPTFPRFPDETPRAFAAFIAFFHLGQNRSLPALVKTLGEKLDSLKRWSARFHWHDRLQAFNSGQLQHQLAADEAARQEHAADWSRRAREYREEQFVAARKLLAAVRCFLESFGDQQLEKMTLAQVSRALQVSSDIALKSFTGSGLPDTSRPDPHDAEFHRCLQLALRQAEVQPAEPSHQAPPLP